MKYELRVVSVERSLFEGEVEFIIANGADGELGVLARHAPLMTVLKPGPLRIQETIGGPEQVLFVGGGFMEVLPERVTVLADGFAYDGKTFGNLSEIAGLITGTRWSGPVFFGLKPRPPSNLRSGHGGADAAR